VLRVNSIISAVEPFRV